MLRLDTMSLERKNGFTSLTVPVRLPSQAEHFSQSKSQLAAPAVLLVPDEGVYLSLRLPRIFQEAGVAVDLLCLRGHPLARSRYVRQVQLAKSWRGIEAGVSDYLRQPRQLWQKIIVCHEPSVRRLLASLDPVEMKKWQPGATTQLAHEFFRGKFGLPAAAAQWDLPIPASQLCQSTDEVMAFGAQVGWPVMVKPSDQLGGNGIRKFDRAVDVEVAASKLRFPLLAQKFIFGRRVVIDMVCSGGRLLAWLSSYSIAQGKGPFSYSTGRLHRAMPGLAPLAEKIAAHSRFEGFCGIDCIEEAGSGRIYLLEFNPRPTSAWRFAGHCGVDLSGVIKSWVDERDTAAAPLTLPSGREIQTHYFASDLIRCVRQKDWWGLRHWLPGTHSYHDVPWDDPGVLFAAAGALAKGILPKRARIKRFSVEPRPIFGGRGPATPAAGIIFGKDDGAPI